MPEMTKTLPIYFYLCVYACSTVNWWTSDECNMVNGTNGASFHPVITKNETLYMFSSDLCRCMHQIILIHIQYMHIISSHLINFLVFFLNLLGFLLIFDSRTLSFFSSVAYKVTLMFPKTSKI